MEEEFATSARARVHGLRAVVGRQADTVPLDGLAHLVNVLGEGRVDLAEEVHLELDREAPRRSKVPIANDRLEPNRVTRTIDATITECAAVWVGASVFLKFIIIIYIVSLQDAFLHRFFSVSCADFVYAFLREKH